MFPHGVMVHLELAAPQEEWRNHNGDNISMMHPQAGLQGEVDEAGIRELDVLKMPDQVEVRNRLAGQGSCVFEQDEKHAYVDGDSFD